MNVGISKFHQRAPPLHKDSSTSIPNKYRILRKVSGILALLQSLKTGVPAAPGWQEQQCPATQLCKGSQGAAHCKLCQQDAREKGQFSSNGPWYLWFHIRRFNQPQIKNNFFFNSRKFPKAKFDSTIYKAFTLYAQLFTQHLHCMM